ncbi:hypothetical protein J1C49_15960 [Cognatishimia sp. F0-27]|nr:hypothetical protein [Cognatishimia sp. F0-27]
MAGIAAILCSLLAGVVRAEPGAFFADRKPLFSMDRGTSPVVGASLFVGRAETSLFAPLPEARSTPLPEPLSARAGSAADRIRDLIAKAEAGPDGFDAVQFGARIKPPKPPTQMTLREIDAWIHATPGQPHAIGRYQFIPKTLRWLVARLELDPDTPFTPAVQNRLADLLLADAGLAEALAGRMSQQTFMKNLARTWAGLPMPDGRSYYEGFAGNKATMGFDAYRRAIASILSG